MCFVCRMRYYFRLEYSLKNPPYLGEIYDFGEKERNKITKRSQDSKNNVVAVLLVLFGVFIFVVNPNFVNCYICPSLLIQHAQTIANFENLKSVLTISGRLLLFPQ